MRTRLILITLLASLAAAAHAQAQSSRPPSTTPYSKYTLAGASTLNGAKLNFRAYALLPTKLPDRTANGGSVLRFGPIGSCKFNLAISAKVVARDATETAGQRVARLRPATSQYIYAQGTRASAAWRVIRVKGSASVRGIWVSPTSLRTSVLFGTPTTPVWLEVRGTADEHVEECHSGGPRYIGQSLADAFGAMTGTAFATDLPRPALPPNPAA